MSSLGTPLLCVLLAVSLLGIAAGLQRTRPLLNGHFMSGLVALVMALSMTTTISKDVHLSCNIIMCAGLHPNGVLVINSHPVIEDSHFVWEGSSCNSLWAPSLTRPCRLLCCRMEMNLHVAEKAVNQMNNRGMMDAISARIRELDMQLMSVDEIAHASHKAKEAQRVVSGLNSSDFQPLKVHHLQ